jgi:hypothetical protein
MRKSMLRLKVLLLLAMRIRTATTKNLLRTTLRRDRLLGSASNRS